MEKLTSYFNGSDQKEINETSLLPFPFWRETLAVWTITLIITYSSIIAVDLTLLVTMLKTKRLRNSLNFIHMSILVSQLTFRFNFLLAYLVYVPPATAIAR